MLSWYQRNGFSVKYCFMQNIFLICNRLFSLRADSSSPFPPILRKRLEKERKNKLGYRKNVIAIRVLKVHEWQILLRSLENPIVSAVACYTKLGREGQTSLIHGFFSAGLCNVQLRAEADPNLLSLFIILGIGRCNWRGVSYFCLVKYQFKEQRVFLC